MPGATKEQKFSRTSEGTKLREALSASSVAANGDAIWRVLRIGEGASSAIPSPVLDQLRNDLALLLADDLEDTLALLPIPPEAPKGTIPPPQQTVTFLDFLVG